MLLDKSEFFIAFVLQDLIEKCNIMIFFVINVHCVQDACCPIYNKGLESVSLIQKGIQKLFHGFSGLPIFFTLLIEFNFRRIDFLD